VRVDVGASSDVGRLRTINEDGFVVDDRLALYAVADGMGGHRAGEVASATALEALRAAIAGGKALDAAIVVANSAVFQKAATDRELSGMGTTLTAIAIVGDATLLIGHVGDSRAYRVRDGAIAQITDDHSLVEELVREGRISPEDAKVHPRRAVVTRAIGIDADVDVDLYTVDAHTGDRILICSDGLHACVPEDRIAAILRDTDDLQAATRSLIQAALAAGGPDNVTVIVAQREAQA
jgi:PPM family protein phosphatase